MPLEARPSNEIEYAAVVALLSEMRGCLNKHGGYDAVFRVGVKGRNVRHSHEVHGGEITVMPAARYAEMLATLRMVSASQ